jgi:hypothetical protein
MIQQPVAINRTIQNQRSSSNYESNIKKKPLNTESKYDRDFAMINELYEGI